MPRLIDADVAYKVLTDYYHHRTEIQHGALKEALSKVPTVDAVPVRCKDCIHRPQWKNRELYPPGYWGDDEADIDWTCPLIDRNELRNSWYMDDDFYCPKGERS